MKRGKCEKCGEELNSLLIGTLCFDCEEQNCDVCYVCGKHSVNVICDGCMDAGYFISSSSPSDFVGYVGASDELSLDYDEKETTK